MQGRTKKPATILQILPCLGSGGVEQGTIDMAEAIVRSGGRALIASNGGARLHELKRIGAEHIDLPVHSKNPLTIYKNIKRIQKTIREYNVDLVHARSRAPAWSAYYATRKEKVPFVTTCHAAYKISGSMKRYYNSIMMKGDVVISISNFITSYIQENYSVHPNRIRLIYRGLALHKYHPNAVSPERMIRLSKEWRLPDGAAVILLPARLSPIKGHKVMIEAIAKLNRPDVICVFVGSDQGRKEYRRELEQLIEAKNLHGRIRMVDDCRDMPAAYMLATAVVCPSTKPEGFGRVPVESQAMGRPTISANHGGTAETIIDGKTGWLVEPGGVNDMARALEEALSLDNDQRGLLAMASMQHVSQHFSLDEMCRKTLDVYRELLK